MISEEELKEFVRKSIGYSRDPRVFEIVDRVEHSVESSMLELMEISSKEQSKYLTIMNLCGILGKLVSENFSKDSSEKVCDYLRGTILSVSKKWTEKNSR